MLSCTRSISTGSRGASLQNSNQIYLSQNESLFHHINLYCLHCRIICLLLISVWFSNRWVKARRFQVSLNKRADRAFFTFTPTQWYSCLGKLTTWFIFFYSFFNISFIVLVFVHYSLPPFEMP